MIRFQKLRAQDPLLDRVQDNIGDAFAQVLPTVVTYVTNIINNLGGSPFTVINNNVTNQPAGYFDAKAGSIITTTAAAEPIVTFTVPEGSVFSMFTRVVATDLATGIGSGDLGSWGRAHGVYRIPGAAPVLGADTALWTQTPVARSINFSVVGSQFVISVTNDVAVPALWVCRTEILTIGVP